MITHIGQRVQLRCAPEHKGIVSGLTASEFLVTYDWPEAAPPRRHGEPRERYRYPVSDVVNFDDETLEKTRVMEGDPDDRDIAEAA